MATKLLAVDGTMSSKEMEFAKAWLQLLKSRTALDNTQLDRKQIIKLVALNKFLAL